MTQPTPNRAARRAKGARRSKTLVGVSLVAMSGLATGYVQALRMPAAYAAGSCTVSDWNSLTSCLAAADAWTTDNTFNIGFAANVTLSDTLAQFTPDNPDLALRILGNGFTLNGGQAEGGFDLALLAGQSLSISDLTITGTRRDEGGAIDLRGSSAGSALSLSNVVITDSRSATGEGGAIYVAYSDVSIDGSTFTFNQTGPTRGGGALYAAESTVTVTNSYFANNTSGDGGAVYAYKTNGLHTIEGSVFVNNTASDGGAIYIEEGDILVRDSTFIGNRATDAFGSGGAVVAYYGFNIFDSVFVENRAGLEGGAVYTHQMDYGPQVLSGSVFERNYSGGEGGALYLNTDDTLTILNTSFTDDSAAVDGGAITGDGAYPLILQNSTLTGHRAGARGGAVWFDGPLTILNSTLSGNGVTGGTGKGGAIYMAFQSPLEMSFTTLAGNTTANVDDSGSTLWTYDGALRAMATVISDSGPVPCYFYGALGPATDDSYTFATDPSGSCNLSDPTSDDTFVPSDFELAPLADNGGLTDTMLPALTSPLVTRGPLTDLGTGVSSDQRGAVRPSGGPPARYAIGAVQAGSSPAPGGSNAPVATAGDASASVVSPTTTAGGAPTSWVVQTFTVDDTLLIPTDDTCAINSGSGSCTVTGLTNGQPYAFKATPSNAQGVGRLSPASNVVTPSGTPTPPPPPPPPPPVDPPSAPQNVTGVPGDRQVVVSWSPPASQGSFPVTNYRVTAAPGGQGCLVAAPTLSCTVTGLTNGTAYTFSVRALNGAGWGPSGVSGPVTPTPSPGPTPAPPPQDLPNPLGPGESLLLTDGVPDPNVVVEPNAGDNGLQIIGDDWAMDLDGLDPFGNPLNLGPDGVLILNQQRDVQTSGRGFLGDSDVDLYVFVNQPPTGAGTSADRLARVASAGDPVYVGTVRTTQAGTFGAQLRLPASIPPGVHTLQAVGWSPQRTTRAMNLGVLVAPWIVLDQGTRSADGRHDRIRTGGSTGGIDPGVRLTPWIRYAGQGSFKEGRATILVQGDGSFRWTRQIRKDKRLVAYVSYSPTDSNRVVWLRVR